jgi:hypothetical protein
VDATAPPTPGTWAEMCAAETNESMQRIRGQFVALAKPAYADPDDPLVSPNLGYFNKDPIQANTPLNQDWANMVQEELCNLVVELGGTLDGEVDDQLATLIGGRFAALDPVEVPLALNSRQVLAGTWTVQTTGLLTESANASVIRIPVVAPVGSVITGVRVRGIQASSGNQFDVRLQGVTDDGSIADIGSTTTSDNGINGTAQDVSVALGGSAETVGANNRYFVRVETVGGGAGSRTITGAFVTYRRYTAP